MPSNDDDYKKPIKTRRLKESIENSRSMEDPKKQPEQPTKSTEKTSLISNKLQQAIREANSFSPPSKVRNKLAEKLSQARQKTLEEGSSESSSFSSSLQETDSLASIESSNDSFLRDGSTTSAEEGSVGPTLNAEKQIKDLLEQIPLLDVTPKKDNNAEIIMLLKEMKLILDGNPEYKKNYGTRVDYANYLTFIRAIENGNKSLVEQLLTEKLVDLKSHNKAYSRHEASIHAAASRQHLDIIKILLQHGAEVNNRTLEQENPVGVAIKKGYSDVAIFLLQQGADPNIKTAERENQLCIAVEQDPPNLQLIEMLLQNGADPNVKTAAGESSLCLAVKKGNFNLIKNLFKYGANVNTVTNKEESPLCIAIEQGDPDIVKMLLIHGANVNHRAIYGETPLHIAARKGNVEIIRMLLEYNININEQTAQGDTPLYAAIKTGHKEAAQVIVDELLKLHRIEKIKDIIYIAAERNQIDVAISLLKKIQPLINPLRFSCIVSRVLCVAIKTSNKKLVESLLQEKDLAKTNAVINGVTALDFAISQEMKAITDKANIDAKGKISAQDRHKKAIETIQEIIKIIVKNGGKTAADFAEEEAELKKLATVHQGTIAEKELTRSHLAVDQQPMNAKVSRDTDLPAGLWTEQEIDDWLNDEAEDLLTDEHEDLLTELIAQREFDALKRAASKVSADHVGEKKPMTFSQEKKPLNSPKASKGHHHDGGN